MRLVCYSLFSVIFCSTILRASEEDFETNLIRIKAQISEQIGTDAFRQAQRDVLTSVKVAQQAQLLQAKLESDLAVLREAVIKNHKELIQEIHKELNRLGDISSLLKTQSEEVAARISQNPKITELNTIIAQFIEKTQEAKWDFSAEGPVNFWIIDLDQKEITEHDKNYLKATRSLSAQLASVNNRRQELDVAAQKVIASAQKNQVEIQKLRSSLAEENANGGSQLISEQLYKLEKDIKTDEWDLMLYSEESQRLQKEVREMMRNWLQDQQEAIDRALSKPEDEPKKQSQSLFENIHEFQKPRACKI